MTVNPLVAEQVIAEHVAKKAILITGGTGSFGNQIVRSLLRFEVERVIIYSRDEKKQYDMQNDFSQEKRLHFVIGDVRDYPSLLTAMHAVDIVYHAAALKQVPSCQLFPMEAVRTNITGADNVRRAAIEAGVATVIAISTDKAVKPVNVMGMTKAISERVFLNPGQNMRSTRFVCIRYGNVLGSRGSVVPLFRQRIDQNRPLPITHPSMTRFLLTLSEAIDLVLFATVHGAAGHLYVRKMPATTIIQLAQVMGDAMTGNAEYPTEIVGVRSGEKIHEVLVSEEEIVRSNEHERYFEIMPETSIRAESRVFEYRSDNTHQLTSTDVFNLLLSEGWVTERTVI